MSTTMTNAEWDELVADRVRQAKADPSGYRTRVWAWALTGYAVLLGTLALAVACSLGILVAIVSEGAPVLLIKLAIPGALLAYVIGRSMTISIPPPEGIELRREDAPELFVAIERLRVALDTPPVHHVLLDGDFNASIVQIPRLGPLGWQRNYLTIGLAYMQSLSPEELRSVLAHELGHISRSHGRFGVWIYRLRNSWGRLLDELEHRGHVGSGIARRFAAWYVPRLHACTVALVREHEHEADRAAAEAVGARHAAHALVRASALAPAVGGYWDCVYHGVATAATPPRGVYAGLGAALRGAHPGEAAEALRRALAMPTDTADTHPSLSERLAALGHRDAGDDAHELAAPQLNAADALLGAGGHARLSERLSDDWAAAVLPAWAARHARAAEELEQLARLDASVAAGELDRDSARRRAELAEELRDEDAALAAWRDVLAVDPADAQANVAVGARMLAHGDDAGLRHLDHAIEGSPLIAVRAAEIGYGYLAGCGRADEAARWRARMNSELDKLDAAAEERRGLAKGDELDPHGLDAAATRALTGTLADIDQVARAYVARKRVAHLADQVPLYVVGIERRSRMWRLESDNADARLVQRVAEALELPGELIVVSLSKPNKWLRKRLQALDSALVFQR